MRGIFKLSVFVIVSSVAAAAPPLQSPAEMQTLSLDQAKAFGQVDGVLALNGLTSLSDEVALVLSQHKGRLGLNGLLSLPENQAKLLAQHAGPVSLNGLTSLSDHLAKRHNQPETPD